MTKLKSIQFFLSHQCRRLGLGNHSLDLLPPIPHWARKSSEHLLLVRIRRRRYSGQCLPGYVDPWRGRSVHVWQGEGLNIALDRGKKWRRAVIGIHHNFFLKKRRKKLHFSILTEANWCHSWPGSIFLTCPYAFVRVIGETVATGAFKHHPSAPALQGVVRSHHHILTEGKLGAQHICRGEAQLLS